MTSTHLDIPVFDADNHLYENRDSLTKFLPDRYKRAIDYVDVRGRTKIVVRGQTVMGGYWQNDDATAKTIRDGWLWTGDMGAMDEDGFVTMHDRSKDMIISGGSNIYPREVEEVLLEHPGVSEVAVVGRKHPEWGEIVVAFVVPVPGYEMDPAALDAHCVESIARFKKPKEYRQIAELPKNNYGKVLKTDLRDILAKE